MKIVENLEHPLYRLMLKRGFTAETIQKIKSEVHTKACSTFTATMVKPWTQDKAKEMLEHIEKKMANLLHSLWLEEKITFIDTFPFDKALGDIFEAFAKRENE